MQHFLNWVCVPPAGLWSKGDMVLNYNPKQNRWQIRPWTVEQLNMISSENGKIFHISRSVAKTRVGANFFFHLLKFLRFKSFLFFFTISHKQQLKPLEHTKTCFTRFVYSQHVCFYHGAGNTESADVLILPPAFRWMKSGRWGSGGQRKGAAHGCLKQAERQMRVQRRDGKEEGCAWKISARAFNQARGTCYQGLISCYAAPHTQLIVMARGCEHGRGSCKSKGLAT